MEGPAGSLSYVVGLPNNSYKPITNTAWGRAQLCKLQKGCIRLAVASDKIYQLLSHGRWFSPGTPVSPTTKTGRHDIAEILLKVALNTKNHQKITNLGKMEDIKGSSKAANRGKEYNEQTIKDRRTNNDLQNNTTKTKD